jgi:hypothetical protein
LTTKGRDSCEPRRGAEGSLSGTIQNDFGLCGSAFPECSLHAPGHQLIIINPASIVSMRTRREHNESYLHESANCVLSMSNGKLISVVENCDQVRAAIERAAVDGLTRSYPAQSLAPNNWQGANAARCVKSI